MNRRTRLRAGTKVLVLGSGALKIGEAGEFDYSGSQAIKALREEGMRTVLVNPNIATIQTSEKFADEVYFLPVDAHFVERVIERERPEGIVLSFGGQTALNCGLALADSGVLARHSVEVLGTPISAVRATEDRQLFIERLGEIGVRTARSRACRTPDEALAAADEIGYPVILRVAFALGGKGSAVVRDRASCAAAVARAFSSSGQVLVEEYLAGWKEIEYEVVRDADDNCLTVCNMENVDPMGIHTGESIVVAPTQTLDDAEVQLLRTTAIRTIRHLGIVGECNIQYALDPASRDYRVIEVNARLSRSSALASKATGYPLAYVAAKLAVGWTLPELTNSITRTTSAYFEPALDYIVCKIPRWDLEKFAGVESRIGSEMKSVGEVMAIGRSFPEALQKALRMLEIGVSGLDPRAYEFEDLASELANPSPRRIFAVARALDSGMPLDEVHRLSSIDRFFLAEIEGLLAIRGELGRAGEDTPPELLRQAKRAGFSDGAIAEIAGGSEASVRARRQSFGIRPHLAQIDTLAAEYPAETNYLYFTYAADGPDVVPTNRRKVLVLGSGCYRIGSSVEFDWCCVSAAQAAREAGFETILLNCNPETVSTDYDICDRLVFDEISLETVLELVAFERPEGVLASMGGQTPNNLALPLHREGVRLLGTPPESVDRAEDRGKFSALLDELGIDQPRWASATNLSDVEQVVAGLGGYPVLVRPSYVLSGQAMRVAHNGNQLTEYLAQATRVSRDHPVVISKFEGHAREIEFDAVADRGELVVSAISEHIEDAGVHSGDATLMLPAQWLYFETMRRAKRVGEKLARALQVTGPFNIQLLARHNEVKVIECNLRAARSFPFVSKTLGVNLIREATRAMLGVSRDELSVPRAIDLDFVCVKVPQFSFGRLAGADPTLGVEMASTGEVACFGLDRDEALLKGLCATGFRFPEKGVLLSLGPDADKYRFADEVETLSRMKLRLYATPGTAAMLRAQQIACTAVEKDARVGGPDSAADVMRRGEVDLVIHIPRDYDAAGRPDGYAIRRTAIDREIPLLTDLWLARRVVQALSRYRRDDLSVVPWSAYLSSARH